MDFSLTEEQQELAGLVRRIAGDHASPEQLREAESGADRHDPVLWRALAEAGVLSAGFPESVGGGGAGLVEQCSVLIELGRAVAPVPYLASVAIAASALAEFGDAGQCRRWLTPGLDGELVLTAASSDERTTRASREGRTWVLDGTKTAVASGGLAELFLVGAATPDGPVVLLVTPSDPGVRVQRRRVVDSDTEAVIDLDAVRLSEDRLLGAPDQGDAILRWLDTRAAIGACAAQLGVLERGLELTAEHARERIQFGRPIGGFQAVSQRLADAYIDVEAVRLSLWQAAWLAGARRPCEAETATAKFWAAEAGHRVAHTAVHVHGGVGIDLDHVLHRYFVAAKRYEFAFGGGATQQALRLADALLDDKSA